MWFFFGLVTLSLAVLGSFWLRRIGGWVGESVTIVDARGQRHDYQWQESKNKGKPVSYRIGVAVAQGFQLRLIQEGRLQRWGQQLGIGAEQTVGDTPFDRTFFIDSDDPRVGQALRRSPEVRRALLDLREQLPAQQAQLMGFHAYRGRLWIEVSSRQGIPDPSVRHGIASTLLLFAAALQDQSVGVTGVRDPFLFRAIAFLAVSTGLALFGLIALARLSAARLDLDPGHLWALSAVVGVGLALALAFAAMKMLQQSSRAYRVLAELLSIGLIGSVLSSHGLILEFNREFDRAEPSIYRDLRADVRTETYRCGKNKRNTCTRHILSLDGDCPAEIKKLRIPRDLADRIRSALFVRVEIKPGALGGRWISAIEPEARLGQSSAG